MESDEVGVLLFPAGHLFSFSHQPHTQRTAAHTAHNLISDFTTSYIFRPLTKACPCFINVVPVQVRSIITNLHHFSIAINILLNKKQTTFSCGAQILHCIALLQPNSLVCTDWFSGTMSTARIKQRLQTVLKQRGIKGMVGLLSAFREFDLDHSGHLNWEEFGAALQKCGVAPSPQDIRALFLEFDADGNNEISYNEFVSALRGNLSEKRRAIISRVFSLIDSDRDGIISMTDIGSCFNPKHHPEVKAGLMTVQTLLNAFFETFAVVSKNGMVTLEQFMEYYASASFYEDDESFERSMSLLWAPSPQTSTSAVSRGTTTLENLARSKSSGGSTSGAPGGGSGSGSAVDKLRAQLRARGAKGIIGLARKFRIMDDDGSKSLSMSEFKKGVRECALVLSELELHELFSLFDRDRSGTIDYDEFLYGVRVINDTL
jgi:Ca2+-binding EF-hand superfamily protein